MALIGGYCILTKYQEGLIKDIDKDCNLNKMEISMT